MNCNNKTAKNKDSSIPDISNGQAVLLRGTVHWSLLKLQDLDYHNYKSPFTAGIANFIDEWSHCDFRFTNFGVILENLESSITTKKAIFRLYSTWSWHK